MDPSVMPKDKFLDKPFEKSYTLVIVASLVVAVLMPFVNALTRGDNEVAIAASYASVAQAPLSSPAPHAANMADELSMVGFGAFLLGLGVVLRRIA
jgi:hypothetical protein